MLHLLPFSPVEGVPPASHRTAPRGVDQSRSTLHAGCSMPAREGGDVASSACVTRKLAFSARWARCNASCMISSSASLLTCITADERHPHRHLGSVPGLDSDKAVILGRQAYLRLAASRFIELSLETRHLRSEKSLLMTRLRLRYATQCKITRHVRNTSSPWVAA